MPSWWSCSGPWTPSVHSCLEATSSADWLCATKPRETVSESGWARLAKVGSLLGKTHTSFDPRNYGFKKLRELVRAQPYLEVRDAPDQSGFVHVELRLK
ncbi:OST-HTH/LOTUS domain-containing protein [Comamonas thiooxydans]|uniref:OST-HTH/LOTUS domain-containing protein n=1 Tax=Comamonas thiooxydans TaxID=363952 RepID=UPI003D05D1D5